MLEGEEFQELLPLMNIVTIFSTSTQCTCILESIILVLIGLHNKGNKFPLLLQITILLIFCLKTLNFHNVLNTLYKVSVNKLCFSNITLQRIFLFLTSATLETEGCGGSTSFRNNGTSK